ncbi:MAG TPA: single-stranded DNA-binding protein [Firmicutes bacterium]|nr:single-stranded DNA-binding protein [Bacillota bacterium]
MNRVVLVGRLARDPELRYTQSGIPVANFTIAVNRPFTNQQGEREADFIDVVVWRAQAENCANYLTKGSLAGVDGRLQVRSYETPEGQKRRVAEVIADRVEFLGRPREGAAAPGPGFMPAGSPDENEVVLPPEDEGVPF